MDNKRRGDHTPGQIALSVSFVKLPFIRGMPLERFPMSFGANDS
jgi:hypothetical protein